MLKSKIIIAALTLSVGPVGVAGVYEGVAQSATNAQPIVMELIRILPPKREKPPPPKPIPRVPIMPKDLPK